MYFQLCFIPKAFTAYLALKCWQFPENRSRFCKLQEKYLQYDFAEADFVALRNSVRGSWHCKSS
jgi:hypothetical protein